MQNTNIVATYDYYTLDQARQIIAEENRQKAIRRAERKARKKAEKIYYIKQKLSGLTMAAMAEFTKESAEFWNNKCDEAIEEFEKLFNNREEAREYCRTH